MSSSLFRVRNEKLEPRHSAIPVFLMLIWDSVFTLMSQPVFYTLIIQLRRLLQHDQLLHAQNAFLYRLLIQLLLFYRQLHQSLHVVPRL